MKCRFCGTTMRKKGNRYDCSTCGHSSGSNVVRDEMSYFRSRAAEKIADIDFPSVGKPLKRKKKL